jgi:Ca2+-binding EF-hand superfamily protein
VPGVRLDVMTPTIITTGKYAFRSRYLSRFHSADRDANGYLDMNEANSDNLFRELFPVLDKDGDGKLFEKELIAALDEVEELAAVATSGIVTVELVESGRGLFGLFDADGDGKLSVRELRALPKLVERFDANGDGALAPSEVPRRFEATLTPGLGAGRVFAPQPVRFGGPMGQPRPPVGPMWFQKMDRNRDGDVSRREFLGSDDEFRKLDTDGDGLISVQEAEAAEKK